MTKHVLLAQALAFPGIMDQASGLWDCAPVLEARLLPKLDPRSKLTLAATSHKLRHWLLSLPTAFWQVGTFLMQHKYRGQSHRHLVDCTAQS